MWIFFLLVSVINTLSPVIVSATIKIRISEATLMGLDIIKYPGWQALWNTFPALKRSGIAMLLILLLLYDAKMQFFLRAGCKRLKRAVVFFDGYCAMCSAFANFILLENVRENFFIASLQGESATNLLPKHELISKKVANKNKDSNYDSIILRLEESSSEKSTSVEHHLGAEAVLKILILLGGVWQWMAFFYVMPSPLRQRIYFFMAKRRYFFFKRRSTCAVPTSNLGKKEKFLP